MLTSPNKGSSKFRVEDFTPRAKAALAEAFAVLLEVAEEEKQAADAEAVQEERKVTSGQRDRQS